MESGLGVVGLQAGEFEVVGVVGIPGGGLVEGVLKELT